MSITATVTSSPITATASASSVTAAVSSSSVTASAAGGVGPQGPIGNTGAGGGATQMSELSDVLFTSLAANDVLRYSSSKWRNYPETSVTDGGNF